jgi:hypothetical protein
MKKVLSFVFLLAMLVLPAHAQQDVIDDNATDCANGDCSIQLTSSVMVPQLMKVYFGSQGAFDNLTPTIEDFNNGFVAEEDRPGYARPKVQVSSNVPWKLSIKAGQAEFDYSGDYTNPSKPASDMHVSPGSNNVPYFALSTTDQQFDTGDPVGPGKHVASMDQKILFSWDKDVPGTYSLPIILTLAAQ